MTKNKNITVWIGETAPTPLGVLWVAMSENGLWACSYDISRQQFIAEVLHRGPVTIIEDHQKVAAGLAQLNEFLEGKRQSFDLPIDWAGMTDFQVAVRQATMAIPFGETSTYGDVAASVDRPGAARAVGRVQATNPLPLVVPCHRVLGADGGLHGYGGSGGLKTKAWLLNLEGAQFTR
ncbi:MAG: methylated-DNA--[protein]-cysteine S-methyltransferase [Anaerolineales bacterium]|nr:methylated-DNA--[protein]-cysteine S-methyltransferase [Anaerolineales bacterium]